MKQVFFLAILTAFLATSCEKNDKDSSGIFKGPVQTFQHGKAWSWYQTDANDKPLRVALSIDEAAMNSLDRNTDGGGEHQHANNVVLELHPKAGVTPFKHIWLNWNPAGHPPANIYGLAHFDFHFYMTTAAERENYLDPVKLDASPAAEYLPANHMGVDPVPTMGKHFIDLTSPELDPVNPQTFTQTFIYGTYNSNVVFYEPMITEAFILATNEFTRDIPQPAKYKQSGYYPTKMRISKTQGIVNIILEGFVYRTAS